MQRILRRTLYTSGAAAIEPITTKSLSNVVLERINKCLQKDPEFAKKPAVICAVTGRTMTYGEFPGRVAAAAKKITPGTLLVHLPNCPEFPVAFHGALAGGNRVSTSNPLYGPRELAHQIKDAGVTSVLTAPMFKEVCEAAVAGSNIKVHCLGDPESPVAPSAEIKFIFRSFVGLNFVFSDSRVVRSRSCDHSCRDKKKFLRFFLDFLHFLFIF